MPLPIALAKLAEEALVALAPEVVPAAVRVLQRLGAPIPPEVVPLVEQIVQQIAASPNPADTAKRALIATASSEAADKLLAQLMK